MSTLVGAYILWYGYDIVIILLSAHINNNSLEDITVLYVTWLCLAARLISPLYDTTLQPIHSIYSNKSYDVLI